MSILKAFFFWSTLGLSQCALSVESLVGVWELESARYTKENGELVDEIKDGKVKSLKIITKKHFSFITQDKDGKFLSAGAGTYQLNKKEYAETLSAISAPKMLGKTYRFTYEFDHGVWIHKGMEDGVFIEEHWRKIE